MRCILISFTAFEHVTSWLDDLKKHADENVSIIREPGLILLPIKRFREANTRYSGS